VTEQIIHKTVTDACSQRLTYTAAGNSTIETVELPEIANENVLVKTLFSGISRGTESQVFAGKIPTSEHSTMKCPHMVGTFNFPVSYGYACAGEVVKTGSGTKRLHVGDRVFVLHPHQSFFQVSEAICNLIPEGVSIERAVLAANMETALNAVWDAEISENERACAVIGAGVVGLLTAHALKELHGITPVVFDINPDRSTITEKLGATFINSQSPVNKPETEFDVLFNTSAAQQGLQSAIEMASFEAKIIEMSWFGTNPVTLDLGGAFHSKRLKILSSQVGNIAPSHRDKFDYSDRMQQALSLLESKKLDCILEKPIDFKCLPDHLPDIFGSNSTTLCQLVAYG